MYLKEVLIYYERIIAPRLENHNTYIILFALPSYNLVRRVQQRWLMVIIGENVINLLIEDSLEIIGLDFDTFKNELAIFAQDEWSDFMFRRASKREIMVKLPLKDKFEKCDLASLQFHIRQNLKIVPTKQLV